VVAWGLIRCIPFYDFFSKSNSLPLTQGRTRTQEGGGEGLKSPYEDFPLPAFRVFFSRKSHFFWQREMQRKMALFWWGAAVLFTTPAVFAKGIELYIFSREKGAFIVMHRAFRTKNSRKAVNYS
jgi:hypothetical protein